MGLVALCAGCKPAPQPAQRVAPASLVPAQAELAIFSRRPASLRAGRADSLIEPLCARWPAAPLHPCDAERWREAGLDPDLTSIVFVEQGRAGMVLSIADPARLDAWLNAASATRLAGAGDPVWMVPGDEVRAALLVASSRGHLLVTDAMEQEPAREVMRHWLTLDDASRWEHIPEQRAMARLLAAEHDLFAVAQPARWLGAMPAVSSQATLMRDLLASRAGLVGLGARPQGADAISITLLHREDSREPAALDALGQAAEPLSPPSAILDAQTPVAVHMAFDPSALWALWRSTMPPEERKQVDDLVESLREDFMLDLERALIHNIQGHVLITLCGLQPGTLELGPLELVRQLVTLQATQELIVIPLHDGRKLTQAFDIFTTLSRGALRRQTSGKQVQYALFDEGALSWVFMVRQDDLLIADSASAFALARAYAIPESTPAPPWMVEALSTTEGLGVAAQIEPLRQLVPTLPAWLRDVESITARTIPDADPLVERVQILVRRRISLDSPPHPGEAP
jgi:hypothetical protein